MLTSKRNRLTQTFLREEGLMALEYFVILVGISCGLAAGFSFLNPWLFGLGLLGLLLAAGLIGGYIYAKKLQRARIAARNAAIESGEITLSDGPDKSLDEPRSRPSLLTKREIA